MMFTKLLGLLFSLSIFLFPLNGFCAEEYGTITDVSSQVFLQRGDDNVLADLGTTIKIGDRIDLKGGEYIVIVSYLDCSERSIAGPRQFTITESGELSSMNNPIKPDRRLPVCYKTEKFMNGESNVTGGIVLRGKESKIDKMRKENESSQTSNSTLITLIIYDLIEEQPEKARENYDILKVRYPDSPFVKWLSNSFK